MKSLAIQLAKLRAEQGMTPGDLAEKAKVQVPIVRSMEEGNLNVDIDNLVRVAKALGVTLNISFKTLETDECPECGWPGRRQSGACECGWFIQDSKS